SHRTDGHAENCCHQRRQQADGNRNPAAEERAAERVAAEVIRAEPVRERRRGAAIRQVKRIRRVGRKKWRDDRGGGDRRQPESGALHDVTRGSIQAWIRSAIRLKTTTATELTI